MKRILKTLFVIGIIIFILVPKLLASSEKEITKTFEADKKLKLSLVLGSCKIEKSNDKKVHLLVRYTYNDKDFQVAVSERSHSIMIEEKLDDNPRGYSDWFLSVPDNAEIEFNTATGYLSVDKVNVDLKANSATGKMEIANCTGEYELNSGTGPIEVVDSKGEFKLSSGTGKIEMESSEGVFEANTGTGRIQAQNLTFTDDSNFNSGTGNVEIVAPDGKEFDLSVSSGTGAATLKMMGKPVSGYFEFSANDRRGRIISPIKFDGEEQYSEGSNEKIRKWFKKIKDTPRYFINTGTGKAELAL